MFVEMYVLFMLASLLYVQFGIRADGSLDPALQPTQAPAFDTQANQETVDPELDRWRTVWENVNTTKSFDAWYQWCQERSMSLEKLEQRLEMVS